MSNGLEQAKQAITEVCEALKTSPAIGRAVDNFREFLLAKNKAYGNSIYEPVRVFTSASIDSLILVRLNDKATRLLKGESGGEDSFDDLLGYLILRKALPLYLDNKKASGEFDRAPTLAWAIQGLTDEERNDPNYAAHLEMVAANIESATRDGVDLTPAYSRSLARGAVPGHVVTQSIRDRRLRVGMTYQEVRDNKWTECECARNSGFDPPLHCTESDPCFACKFLDGALCKCGELFALHGPSYGSAPRGCGAFSLASWSSDPISVVDEQPDGVAYHEGHALRYTAIHDDPTQTTPVAEQPAQQKETDMTDTNATTTKKSRIDRKTWHESPDGKHAVGSVLGFLSENPIVSWAIGKLTERSGLARADVDLAIDHLLSTGAIVQHGKAKGTRYAVAGFTDWPAPVPRNRKSNEPPVSEADADAAHSLDASDNEET